MKNFWKRKSAILETKTSSNPAEQIDGTLSSQLKENEAVLKKLFKNCSDIVYREIEPNENPRTMVVFVDGMVDSKQIHANALKPLLFQFSKESHAHNPTVVMDEGLALSQLKKTDQFPHVIDAILNSSAVLFIDGYSQALVLNVPGATRRGVEEPTTEAAIRGPREGFTENLRTNTALVRVRLKSPACKMESFKIGTHTKTNVVLSYMQGIADPKVIAEVRRRLTSIQIDSILESGYIEELIEDQPYSPFPQFHYTERPDTVVAQLLEGKFAIFTDGTPFVIMAPVTFWQMVQASEDYYERYFIANFIRWLRFACLFLALFLPSIYIAITTFHQDMLPTTLLLSIAAAREAIPFPAFVEALIMELSFEALREASVRLPKTVGQAVSILGALVIGQSAVQAGIVSAPMVIIVSLTGIASFTVPRFNFAISIRLLRFPLMALGSALGLFGLVVGTLWITLHLCELKSFGVPYLSGIAPYRSDMAKDILVRAPWWKMILRPSAYFPINRKRMRRGMKPAAGDDT